MSAGQLKQILDYLEAERQDSAAENLDKYCRYIEIPGTPMNDDEDCQAFYPDYVTPARHHSLINRVLQDVDRGKYRRVMIFMPPGSAKSTYASVVFPTWYMGRNPGINVISTSYGSDLSKKFGRKCRQITRSPNYKEIFKCTLVADNQAVDNWSLTNQSTYMGGGMLSGITGNRADGLVIDDPIKGREDAESPTMRAKTWEAYLSDLRTRLKPNGWIIIIQTRWHVDDLSGRILPDHYNGESGLITARDGEQWKVICLQAECKRKDDPLGREIGDYLWLEWFNREHWEQEKKTQGGRNWAALYQQSPRLEDGGIFNPKWFQYYRVPNEHVIRIVQSWDTAQKEGELNDYSVCTTWKQTPLGYYLVDRYRDRLNFPALIRAIKSLAEKDGCTAILIEDKGSGISAIQQLQETTDLPVIAIEPVKDKAFRAAEVSPLYEAGLVYHPEQAPWLIDTESELALFPAVDHDDTTDSITQALKWMRAQHDRFELITGRHKRISY